MTVLDSRLVFLLVDNFFGGGRFQAKIEGREFTTTETLVLDQAITTVFDQWKRAWGGALEEIQLLQKEVTPEAIGFYNSNDIAVVSTFSVDFDVSGGKLHIVLPYGMVEPIRELLDKSGGLEEEARDNRWAVAMRKRILEANVDLRCTVAETQVSLRDVIDLQVGDVIPLSAPQAVLNANDIPLFDVRMGRLKENLALQVLGRAENER